MKNESWKHYEDAEILARVSVRLIEAGEKARWDALIVERHYLGNANLVGRQLRYVAELDGQWVALLGWNVAAYHLKGREQWLGWTTQQRLKRRKFIAQNSRYLLLVERGRYPNLASRVLGLCTRRLSEDWEGAFGHPLLGVESFVDPQRFSGSCYRAAGWTRLGSTKGYRRHHRDFYQEDGRPKELWMRSLHPKGRRWLAAQQMPARLARHEDPVLSCPYSVNEYRSLWEGFNELPDVRRSKGRRHRLASTLTICALGTLCGARGTRALADFARYLNQTQLRLMRGYRNPKTGRYEAPSEPTIRRMLKNVPADEFDKVVFAWTEQEDPEPLRHLAVDGKTIKGSRRADGRPVHLVGALSPDSSRLVAQRPVDEKSNEITALRPMLKDQALDEVVVTADAMQAQQDAARFLHQEKGADYFFSLKGNQPSVQEKAQRLFEGAFPP
ncbi:MAG: ISAs1 family transposase [Alphaproteobacteria bacterium]|nr:ISAs1 family transposase [Alphaproteobacteria bacterium]